MKPMQIDISAPTFMTQVRDHLDKVDARMKSQTVGSHPDLSSALIHLLNSGGKRVRPMVTLMTGQMLGAEVDRLVTLAAAVEMLHTATLVHDDLIDGSLLRRGMATINAQWSPAATVLTGDYVFARAAHLAAETDSVKVMKLFAHALSTIVNGEINQYFTSRGVANRQDYYQRIYAKTASMFELAAGAAAVLSPVDRDVQARARKFGYEIGMAFQIMDDILDYTGDQQTVGKPLASDLRQGLITLPALCYYETHPDDPDILSVIQRNGYNDQKHQRLVGAIRSSDAIDRSLAEAREFIKRAQTILAGFPDNTNRSGLEDLAEYIVDRSL